MVLDPVNGVAKGEGGCLLLQNVRSSAVEEHDWEALVHSCKNGGKHRPVVECNRHNWCSVGVTTSSPHHSFLYTIYIYIYIAVARRAPDNNLIIFCPLVYNFLTLQCETAVRLEAWLALNTGLPRNGAVKRNRTNKIASLSGLKRYCSFNFLWSFEIIK